MQDLGRAAVGAALFGIVLALGLAAPCLAASFRWANDVDVRSLDPYARQEVFLQSFVGNIYEPLVRRGRDLALEPALATSWMQVAPRIWRFALRQGVRFHDGTPLTADDVVFSFDRVRASTSHLGGAVASIKEVRKLDDWTVDLVTNAPDPLVPEEIASWSIMSKAWCEANDAAAPADLAQNADNFATDHANGTGPFMLKQREPNVRTVLVRNPAWWDQSRHNLDEAIFEPIADPEERVAALAAGTLDMIYSVPPDEIERIARTPGLRIVHGPDLRTIFLGFNLAAAQLPEGNVKGRNPFKDRRVRLAFYRAIDEGTIAAKIMRGMATPAGLLVAPDVNGFDPGLNTRMSYNPAAAQKLLAEAGYPAGFATGMDCPTDRFVNDEAICQEVAAMLAQIGVKVTLLAQPRAQYFAKILGPKRSTSFYLFGWVPSTYDALNALVNLAATRSPATAAGAYNIGGYSNPALDALLVRIAAETDGARRTALLREALTIVRDDVAYIPLHQQALVWAVRAGIDLAQPPDGDFSLRHVAVKE